MFAGTATSPSRKQPTRKQPTRKQPTRKQPARKQKVPDTVPPSSQPAAAAAISQTPSAHKYGTRSARKRAKDRSDTCAEQLPSSSPPGASGGQVHKRKRSSELHQERRGVEAFSKQPKKPQSPNRDTGEAVEAQQAAEQEASGRELWPFAQYIEHWAQVGHWPPQYFESDDAEGKDSEMQHASAGRKSRLSYLPRPEATASMATPTPSDQKPREEKIVAYQSMAYELRLAEKGSFMEPAANGVTPESEKLCHELLTLRSDTPTESLFDDDVFEMTISNLRGRNEARVIADIARLIVPSAEALAGRKKICNHVIETVNEGWNKSIPLMGTRPQPDFSVGVKVGAFTDEQRKKLQYLVGPSSDASSFFSATYLVHFPFLTSEVKCGTCALEFADRQNAHSMTLAVRGIVELFRAVKREAEVDRTILSFSISHNDCNVRLYGHYAVIDGPKSRFYRHPIQSFMFTSFSGRDKWMAYSFVRNIYEHWVPQHVKRICSAIDDLPAHVDLEPPSLDHGSQRVAPSASSDSLPDEDGHWQRCQK